MSIHIHIPDHILYEDDVVLVINKPAGLMVEPDRNGHPNLLNEVKRYLKDSLSPQQEIYAQHIHRLDRPVSGIVLFAKQRSVLKNLSEQFAERKVKKYYQAITEQAPASRSGTLEHWHRKEKKKAVLYAEEVPYSEKAALSYEVADFSENRFLWSIELHTGKYHQIRAQLAHLGCPILGDSIYGSVLSYRPDCIALHASKLIFFHPVTNEKITIESRFSYLSD
jgi:23S rRNA pseudouridine955/2504/2580 synthase/23S rRNA pseudouridine1911/1915/1917 synthase